MRLKVLFHVNETERWPRVLTNINNFMQDVGQGHTDIEIVANGTAVLGCVFEGQDSSCGLEGCGCGSGGTGTLSEEMFSLNEKGVIFTVCFNALRAHNLSESQLLPFVKVVAAGITAIAAKQAQGYAYIKP